MFTVVVDKLRDKAEVDRGVKAVVAEDR